MALIKKSKDDAAASAEPVASADSDAAAEAEAPADEPGQTPAASDPFAGGADVLLNMFQTTQAAADDRTRVLDLTPDVELSDLLEDLHTVAVAMGIRRGA